MRFILNLTDGSQSEINAEDFDAAEEEAYEIAENTGYEVVSLLPAKGNSNV